MSLYVRIAAWTVGTLAVLAAVCWVLRIGPFKPQLTAAQRVEREASRIVEEAEDKQEEAVAAVTAEAHSVINSTARRTHEAVEEVRRAERAAPVAAPYPDAAFYRGVCQSRLYAGNPQCSGYGGRPASEGASAR